VLLGGDGVEDDEGTGEQRDEREYEQEHADEAQRWWMLCCPSAMTAWPLTTWTFGVPRTAARSRLISSGRETRGAAWMSIWLTLPGWPRTRAARAGVRAVAMP